MLKVDWKWFILGILFALFVYPFVQAKLGSALGGRKSTSANIV